jgi:hypothetical protein
VIEWLRLLGYRAPRHTHRRYRNHHRHIPVVIFAVNGVAIRLHPYIRIRLMITVNVGHEVLCTIEQLDQNGNPMLTAVVADSPPSWSDTPATPPVDTFTPAADGSSATLVATAVGTDTVNVSASFGGKTYTASLAVTIAAAPQVLTSIAIDGVVQ